MKAFFLLAAVAVGFAEQPAFEVVSIKPVLPGTEQMTSSHGGPGTKFPGTWSCQNMALSNIAMISFQLRAEQLVAPEWMNEPRFTITAKVPEGATPAQLHEMLQNMLAERFGLKFHRAQKEFAGYELVIAKNGPKFSESKPEVQNDDPPAAPPRGVRPSTGQDGFPVPIPGINGIFTANGRSSGQWLRVAMDRFAKDLQGATGKFVINATGLTGKYDMQLRFVSEWAPRDVDGPRLFGALESQLGLKLRQVKVMNEVVIIDHAEKVPTEN